MYSSDKIKDLGFNPDDYYDCLRAVKKNGFNIMYIENQTPELCFAAIKQTGYALEYIKEEFKTDELCEMAKKRMDV